MNVKMCAMFRTLLIAVLILGLPLRGMAAVTMFPCASPVMAHAVESAHDMHAVMDMSSERMTHTNTEHGDCVKVHGAACVFGAAVAPGPTHTPDVAQIDRSIFLPDILTPATFTPEQPDRPPRVLV